MRLPPLNAVRAFEAVARLGSVRRASEELRVDHSVVSRHVRLLQDHLGVQLLVSSRKGIELTQAGRDYGAVIGAALQSISGATAELLDIGKAEARTITAWCVPGLALHWLAGRLPQFHKLYPQAEVILRPSDSPAELMANDVDLEIHYGHRQPRNGIQSIELARPRIYPVASPRWIEAHPPIDHVSGLLKADLIHEENENQWRQWFACCGMPEAPVPSGLRLWHANMAIESARRGHGVALANDLLVSEAIAAGDLVELVRSAVHLEPYVFSARLNRWEDRWIARFRRWLISEIEYGGAALSV